MEVYLRISSFKAHVLSDAEDVARGLSMEIHSLLAVAVKLLKPEGHQMHCLRSCHRNILGESHQTYLWPLLTPQTLHDCPFGQSPAQYFYCSRVIECIA